MWAVLENAPFEFEKNVYSAAFGRSSLWMSITPNSLMEVLSLTVPLQIFCLLDLSFSEQDIEISDCESGPMYFSLQFCQFFF